MKALAILVVIGIFIAGIMFAGKSLFDAAEQQQHQFAENVRMQDPGASEYDIAVAKFTKHLNSLLGTPYHFGGVDPATGGVDCSGLLRVASVLSGYPAPRTNTKGIWATWDKIDDSEKGAVGVFFRNGRPVHVGFWVAPPEMIHASSSKGVERRDITSQGGYWSKQLTGHRLIPSIAHLRQ